MTDLERHEIVNELHSRISRILPEDHVPLHGVVELIVMGFLKITHERNVENAS